MSYQYYFEKLDVWKLSKDLTTRLYSLIALFPSEEKFGIISQIRRAAVSVPTNLAEGSSRKTKKDQANFTTLAYSSLMEVLNLIIISRDLKYIDEESYDLVRGKIEEISNKLNALRNTQLATSETRS